MAKGRFIKAYLNRWRQLGTTTLGLTPSSSSTSYDRDGDNCCFLQCWAMLRAPCANDTLLHAEEEDEQENSIKEEKIIMKRTSSSLGIPKDVPKGHLVVYVGEDYKRFVIKISLLKHPLFKALLDRAREEYNFTHPHSKLCIPCEEKVFLSVIRCANTPGKPSILLCRS
ncbi:hypothetical protein C5167_001153 [Papaver somniferum]|uniref:Uncharacterized protein n=1 Tax=Papaver somniferum TaxID=3469 RepID=A0A4Y7KY16_PAPSO|nr:auxin-responsive protein SAUR50-like [Papaver somniferum]RZC76981.1 hypothetical protein C5167_001153 [Papaver somniferum]